MVEKQLTFNKIKKNDIAYLLGLFDGDGYLYYDKWRHYKIDFYLNPIKDIDIKNFIFELLNKFGLNPYIMNNQGCVIVRVNSKQLFFLIKNFHNGKYSIRNKGEKIGYLSGLIDSDGYVSKGDIVISNTNPKIINQVKEICITLKIPFTLKYKNNDLKNKTHMIWILRIGTSFKYEKHYSQKIFRIYGGAAAHHSE